LFKLLGLNDAKFLSEHTTKCIVKKNLLNVKARGDVLFIYGSRQIQRSTSISGLLKKQRMRWGGTLQQLRVRRELCGRDHLGELCKAWTGWYCERSETGCQGSGQVVCLIQGEWRILLNKEICPSVQ